MQANNVIFISFPKNATTPLAALSVIRTEKAFRTFRQLDISCLARDHSVRVILYVVNINMASFSQMFAGRKRDSHVWKYFKYDIDINKCQCTVLLDDKSMKECAVHCLKTYLPYFSRKSVAFDISTQINTVDGMPKTDFRKMRWLLKIEKKL